MSTEIIVAALGFLGVLIAQWTMFCVSIHHGRKIEEINDAVNHRHLKGDGSGKKLYDLAWENHQKVDELIGWKRGYDQGPLSTGAKVTTWVSKTNDRLDRIEMKVDALPCLERPTLPDDCPGQ